MAEKSDPSTGQGQGQTTVPEPDAPAACRRCRELELAEAVANSEPDYSKAADCRVLLRRHQQALGCTGTCGGSV